MIRIPTSRVWTMCGVKRRTFYSWLSQDIIPGIPARAPGGKYRPFTPRQVTFVRLARRLRQHYFGLDDVRDALRVLDDGWNGQPPGQLLADRLGWQFEQRFLVQVDGKVYPLVAAPPILWDVGNILGSVLLELEDWEAAQEVDNASG